VEPEKMTTLERIKDKARAAKRTVVLPEGTEPRVAQAARMLVEQQICRVILIGEHEAVASNLNEAGVKPDTVETIQPDRFDDFERYVETLHELRKKKGLTIEKARELIQNPLYFGAMTVKDGKADACVAGSVNTTGDVLRAALHVIGLAEGISTISSSFLMTLPEFNGVANKNFMFADCAVLPNPTSEQLASVAAATAQTTRMLLGEKPKIAFLSFSTKGSAKHADIDKVLAALETFRKANLDIEADGELQLDAAIIPKVGASKAPGSPVAGSANVLIFPDLDAGNIGYKLVQRMAGAIATGPIIQGLALPMNDLSRGCSAEDIVNVSAIALLMKG
jgi:phosphate acetyltransferase